MNRGNVKLSSRGWAMTPEFQEMGMEARSILKSIQTEHGKLAASAQIARSDLHYFRARYNYYRLSLTRLEEFEREVIQPSLGQFREQIMQREAQNMGAGSELKDNQPPFLMAVENQKAESNEPEKQNIESSASVAGDSSVEVNSSNELVGDAISELSMIQLALKAEASAQNNQMIGQSISRIISKLKKV